MASMPSSDSIKPTMVRSRWTRGCSNLLRRGTVALNAGTQTLYMSTCMPVVAGATQDMLFRVWIWTDKCCLAKLGLAS